VLALLTPGISSTNKIITQHCKARYLNSQTKKQNKTQTAQKKTQNTNRTFKKKTQNTKRTTKLALLKQGA